ncbi:hypothetical protein LZ32DRAFT_148259 [Colletotrichum eremochloae]|nr:hypothetical protein LZ32DRAFT_148259 [Colletotrichum eremochloae]
MPRDPPNPTQPCAKFFLSFFPLFDFPDLVSELHTNNVMHGNLPSTPSNFCMSLVPSLHNLYASDYGSGYGCQWPTIPYRMLHGVLAIPTYLPTYLNYEFMAYKHGPGHRPQIFVPPHRYLLVAGRKAHRNIATWRHDGAKSDTSSCSPTTTAAHWHLAPGLPLLHFRD